MGMPISALNWTGVDILMWVYPEWSNMDHGSHITALLEKYEFICMYLCPTYVITLISTAIIMSKTVTDQTPTLPHETHMGHVW